MYIIYIYIYIYIYINVDKVRSKICKFVTISRKEHAGEKYNLYTSQY